MTYKHYVNAGVTVAVARDNDGGSGETWRVGVACLAKRDKSYIKKKGRIISLLRTNGPSSERREIAITVPVISDVDQMCSVGMAICDAMEWISWHQGHAPVEEK